ncbi:MAG: SET domain-containing protein [Paraburkholderia sp.]|uniref:SET domain-containing protein n=1 Tax=Paraburkholderia sp. TaxID=1926495 RepID=UPI0011FA83D6|nr:SET domain-containing protein-lysine N-methyltransferase [Paraburkholderia sp.]TAM03223.1 MAG: SET domain-containing protein [Paraburkholderia sp.]TAM30035.1 MAG: SET domain-containing protein [Paraburkholderia sp.]
MRRVSVRHSPVHGRGVFALCALRAGERIFEYRGKVTTWREAARHWQSRADCAHTFLFGLSNGRVIDGGRGGNGARWLNHACAANCETIEIGNRVFIDAICDIRAGEELFIDYALELESDASDETRLMYACRCGTPGCRGTMLGGGSPVRTVLVPR